MIREYVPKRSKRVLVVYSFLTRVFNGLSAALILGLFRFLFEFENLFGDLMQIQTAWWDCEIQSKRVVVVIWYTHPQDKRQAVDVQQYTKYIQKHIREYEEEIKNSYKASEPVPPPPPPPPSEEPFRWSFSGSLFFIGTTLTTIGEWLISSLPGISKISLSGSNEFTPVTKIGKLFLMILYGAIGIPLTLVFLSDLSLLITRLIKYLSLILLRFYSTKSFLHIRQWIFFRFIEKQLNISIATPSEEDDLYLTKQTSLNTSSFDHPLREFNSSTSRAPVGGFKSKFLSPQHHIRRIRKICNILVDTLQDINDNIDLTMPQLVITLFFYLLIGAGLISSTSYFDSIYICFTSLFSINLRNYYRHTTTSQEHSLCLLFFVAIYLLFGLAIVSLCVKAVQIRIQQSLENLGKKLLRDFVEFLRQMGKDLLRLVRCSWLIHLGFHELSTDDILASTEVPAHPMSAPPFDGLLSRPGWPDAQSKKAAKWFWKAAKSSVFNNPKQQKKKQTFSIEKRLHHSLLGKSVLFETRYISTQMKK